MLYTHVIYTCYIHMLYTHVIVCAIDLQEEKLRLKIDFILTLLGIYFSLTCYEIVKTVWEFLGLHLNIILPPETIFVH